ncbi:MAG TPA: YfhO family protein [Candidatus Dormibacteraeota bacterium]|nr:YfhO family protein [Candidatus Dormibacteraeota bacterium]
MRLSDRRRGRATALLLLGAAAIGAWWALRVEAPIRIVRLTATNYDDFTYYYPTFEYAFRQLRAGRLPFWNPYQHCGSPFFATAQHLLLYPLNLFFLLLPTAQAMRLTNVLHVFLAFAFTYALARTHRLRVPAALTAAITFAVSPALASFIYFPHHLYGAVWMPLQLALTHRLLTGRRRAGWAVALGASFACQYLGGYVQYGLFSAYLVGAYALWWGAGEWRRRTRADLAHAGMALAGAALLAVLLAAPLLLPALELAALSPRAAGALSLDTVAPGHAAQRAVAKLWTALLPARGGEYTTPDPAVGVVALLLALVALARRGSRRPALFFLVVAVVSALLALGQSTPFYALYYALPTGNLFRAPLRFFIVTALALSLLAGFGADWLARVERPGRGLWTLLGTCAAIAVIALAALALAPIAPLLRPRVGLLAVYALAAAAWLLLAARLRGTPRRALVWTLPLISFLTLSASFANYTALPETHPQLHAMPAAVADYLRAHQRLERTYLPKPDFRDPRPASPSRSGIREGLYMVGDRENVFVNRFWEYFGRLRTPEQVVAEESARALFGSGEYLPQGEFPLDAASPDQRLLDLAGTRYLVETPGWRYGGDPDQAQPVFQADGHRVLERHTTYPRAFVVGAAEVLAPSAVLDRLTEPAFDPLHTVLLEEAQWGGAEAPPNFAGSARILDYGAERVVIETHSNGPGFLVLTDQDYPGWRAKVDGLVAPIFRADYLFRAVPIDGGTHTVVFRFVPRRFHAGVGLAALGAVLATALVARSRRRS